MSVPALDPGKAPARRLVDPASPSAEPFRSLRLVLQLRTDSDDRNAVVFTSAEPGDGKSTIAANYALVASVSRDSVLLIDGDFRRPTLHTSFGLPRSPGLSDLIATDSPLETYVRDVSTSGSLDLLPAGRPIPRTADFASSARMGSLLMEASTRYGLVVIDAPPVLSATDAAAFALHGGVEVVLVVNRSTRRRDVRKALRRLELTGAPVAGVVFNRHGRLAPYGY